MEEQMNAVVANASASESDADVSDESQGSPSKKRKRNLKISCELCKARKVKCDRAEPSCGWCARNNRVCVYQERKKPGVRIAYVQDLEDKVNRLEAVLHSLGRRVEDHISEHDALHHQNSNQLYHVPGLAPRFEPPRSVPSDAISYRSPTMDSQWQPNGHSHENQLPEPMSVRSVIDPAGPESRPHFNRPRAYTSTPVAESYQSSTDPDLPPYDLVCSLVDLFFKHINPWSPVLDRKSTFDTLFGGSQLAEPDQILMLAIVAATLRFSNDSRLTPDSRQRYHESCKKKVLLHGIQYPSIRALQALLILAIDLLGISCDGSGMNLIALITRNIVQLGLGIEKGVYLGQPNYRPVSIPRHFTQAQPWSWIEEEGRRRLVWMVYILDRYTTVSTCSTFVFSDKDMDRRLPCTYDLFSRNQPVPTRWPHISHHLNSNHSPSEYLGSFSYHCEVLTIMSRVHNFLRQPLDLHSPTALEAWRDHYTTLVAELNAWLASLPGEYGNISQLCHSDPGSKISNWIMLHAAFVTTVIRLHSAAAYPTAHSHLFNPSFNAMQRCLGAVESLREIAQDTISNSMLDLLGPPFAFSLWTSARLLLVHAATIDGPALNSSTPMSAGGGSGSGGGGGGGGGGADYPKIHFFISTLVAMGHHWRLAAMYAETLNRVVLEGQQAQSQSQTMPADSSSQTTRPRTFREMRKAAYQLSAQLSQRADSGQDDPGSVVRVPEANEMEYLDVFEFFNYPLGAGAGGDGREGMAGEDGEKVVGTHSASGVGDGGEVDVRGAGRRRRSPTFLMPARESDWLGFQPPRE